jgi:hypothetical protein
MPIFIVENRLFTYDYSLLELEPIFLLVNGCSIVIREVAHFKYFVAVTSGSEMYLFSD